MSCSFYQQFISLFTVSRQRRRVHWWKSTLNVIPKKRAQQLLQSLTVLRKLSLSRSVTFLRNLTLPRKLTASRSMKSLRKLTLKIPHPHRALKTPLRSSLKIPSVFLKIPKSHAISKKLFTSIFNYRVIWFSASLFMYGWFLSWIAYDIFVWHKSIMQVSPTNYVGAITAMALIWGGTIIFKTPKHVAMELPKRQKTFKERIPRKRSRKPSKLKASTPSQLEQLPLVQPEPETEPTPLLKPPAETVKASSKCSRRIKSSLEIPDQCLVCPELIQCLCKLGK